MKICVKGWSKINHSYSIVCRNELIEFTKLPIDLKFIETPYFNEKWNHSNNFHGFSEKNNKIISLINLPKDKEFFDIIYRFDFPFNFKKSNSKKLFIFATSEYQNIKNMFINEIPKNFQKRDDLKIITSSKWSKKGFVEAGFDYNQVEVISLGVNSDIFYPISLDKKNKIKKKLKFNEGDFVISNIGAMTNNKGIDLLIVAFAILKKKYKNLKCFSQIRPFVGGAIDLGIIKAQKNFIVIMASDMETNPHELNKMINISFKNPKKIISADRWINQKSFKGYGIIKFLANFMFQKLLKFFFNYKILDFTFAYRIYPKKALKRYKIKELRHGFALEILLIPIKNGFNVITVPAKWRKRIEGNSSITIKSYISYLKVLWRNI